MLRPVFSGSFKKDFKLAEKRGWDLAKLEVLMTLIAEQAQLSASYRDHALIGTWRGFRDVHVAPDWVLIYRTDETHVYFERTGTHSDLFKS